MSKSAALLLALALGASACTQAEVSSEPPVVVVANAGSSETDATNGVTEPEATSEETTTTNEPTTTSEGPTTTAPIGTEPPSTTAAVIDTPTAKQLINASVSQEAAITSSRFEGGIAMKGISDGQEIDATLKFSGGQDPKAESSYFYMDMSGIADIAGADATDEQELEMIRQMFANPMQMITIGDKGWVQFDMLTMFFGAEPGMWLEGDGESSTDMDLSTSPSDILSELKEANGTVEVVGQETIRGAETTHYLVTVNLAELAQDLPADERAELEEQFGDDAYLPIHLWIGENDTLHRMEVTLDSSDFDDLAGGDVGKVDIWYEMYDFGADLDIVPPAADLILSEEDLGFDFSS